MMLRGPAAAVGRCPVLFRAGVRTRRRGGAHIDEEIPFC